MMINKIFGLISVVFLIIFGLVMLERPKEAPSINIPFDDLKVTALQNISNKT